MRPVPYTRLHASVDAAAFCNTSLHGSRLINRLREGPAESALFSMQQTLEYKVQVVPFKQFMHVPYFTGRPFRWSSKDTFVYLFHVIVKQLSGTFQLLVVK